MFEKFKILMRHYLRGMTFSLVIQFFFSDNTKKKAGLYEDCEINSGKKVYLGIKYWKIWRRKVTCLSEKTKAEER